jgi:hypothetical protein
MTSMAVPEKALSIRKIMKAARFGLCAVPIDDARKTTLLARQNCMNRAVSIQFFILSVNRAYTNSASYVDWKQREIGIPIVVPGPGTSDPRIKASVP